jgi:hypothetical protein
LTVNVSPAIVRVPVRLLVVVLAATEYETVPFPVAVPPAVIAIHETLLDDVHAHPGIAVTATLPIDAVPPTETLVGEMVALHSEVNANVLDSVLRPGPPGPIATTRASYTVPGDGQGVSSVVKSTRIFPSVCGAGFPRLTTRVGVAVPTT